MDSLYTGSLQIFALYALEGNTTCMFVYNKINFQTNFDIKLIFFSPNRFLFKVEQYGQSINISGDAFSMHLENSNGSSINIDFDESFALKPFVWKNSLYMVTHFSSTIFRITDNGKLVYRNKFLCF